MLKLVLRALVVWAIEVVALVILAWLLPGLQVTRFGGAVLAVLVIGLLNALIRPLILRFAAGLGLIPFLLITFPLNAVMVWIASETVPGFSVDSLWTCFVVAIGLAVLNTLFSALLGINDDDSFYRNVIRRSARRNLAEGDLSRPGTILAQIDGLAEPILREEIEAGHMPTLGRWLSEGSHRLVHWECDVPSMTSSGQAGILHGNNANIPAFRWYDKQSGRLLVSNHPADARQIDQWQACGRGLLREGGSSIGNIFTGGATRNVLTMAALKGEEGQISARPRDFRAYLVNPYNLYRGIGAMIWEILVEYWQAWQQRRKNVLPRMHRGGSFPFLRGASNVIMRDATTYLLIDDMFSGRLVSYADYLGYDEVAHHAGPSTEDARKALRKLDHQIHSLEHVARDAPRPYHLVLLSDHGQSTGATFRQRYGLTLEQLIRQLLESGRQAAEGGGRAEREGETVQMVGGQGEGWEHLNAMLTEMVRTRGVTGKGAERLLGKRMDEDYVNLGPDARQREAAERADVVVCASGNLALVFFARQPGRLSLEQMVADYPGVIEGLAEHEGIGFLLVHSEVAGGPVVMGRRGFRSLVNDRVEGEDPLAPFSSYTARFLQRLSSYPNVGDIVVNSLLDDNGQVAAFEELIGCHGGAGGLQNRPFLMYPAEWSAEDPGLIGSESVHDFLCEHIGLENPPREQTTAGG